MPRNVYDITVMVMVMVMMIVIKEVGRDEIGVGYGRVPGFANAPES